MPFDDFIGQADALGLDEHGIGGVDTDVRGHDGGNLGQLGTVGAVGAEHGVEVKILQAVADHLHADCGDGAVLAGRDQNALSIVAFRPTDATGIPLDIGKFCEVGGQPVIPPKI